MFSVQTLPRAFRRAGGNSAGLLSGEHRASATPA